MSEQIKGVIPSPTETLNQESINALGIISQIIFPGELLQKYPDVKKLSVAQKTVLLVPPFEMLDIDISDPDQLQAVIGTLNQLAESQRVTVKGKIR